MLAVRKHNNNIRTKQYLIAYNLPTHLNHRTVMNNPCSRHIRLDFTTYKLDITHFIPTVVDLRSVKKAQNSLHETTVMTARNESAATELKIGTIHQYLIPKGECQGLPELFWPN